jgi:Cys-tRNA(Pro) deacylase
VKVSARKEPVTNAVRAIRAAAIDYEPYMYDYDRYPGALGAAEAIGINPHLTVKTIVFETSDGQGVIVLMNGDHEISTKTLARLLEVKSTHPAGPDRGKRWTGYEFGGTSPFGTRQRLRIFANAEIATMDRIYVNAGSRGFVVGMAATDLIRALSPDLADLAVR